MTALLTFQDVAKSFTLHLRGGVVLPVVGGVSLAVARLLSHRVMVMQGGRVIETGLTDQVLDDPQAAYTQLLVSSVLAA